MGRQSYGSPMECVGKCIGRETKPIIENRRRGWRLHSQDGEDTHHGREKNTLSHKPLESRVGLPNFLSMAAPKLRLEFPGCSCSQALQDAPEPFRFGFDDRGSTYRTGLEARLEP